MSRHSAGPRARASSTVWVYALTTARPPAPAARGIGGERLRMVRAAGVGAIIGQPPRGPRSGRRVLLRYAAIVEGLARRRASLMPVRFGTCLEVEELMLVLTARAASLRASLTAVRHRAQMNVHVAVPATPESAAVPAPAAVPPQDARTRRVASRRRGTAYLRARAEVAAREAEVAGFEPVRAAVRRWVRGERVETRADRATVSHLVPRAAATAYRRGVERAADAHGLRVRVTGPWAPYAFTDGW